MSKKLRSLSLLLFGITLGFTIFFIIDTVFGFFYPQDVYPTRGIIPRFPPIKPMGYGPDKKKMTQVKKNSSGETIFSVEYNFDQYNRRIVSSPANSEKKTQQALFFGCSNSFGEGLNDQDSIPSVFANLNEDTEVFNYAYGGYGPQHMLARLKSGFSKNEIATLPGYAFYMYFDFHINRVIGKSDVIRWSDGLHPYFELNDKKELIDRGFFLTSRPIYTLLTWHLSNSHILNFFDVTYPKINQHHYETTCEVFKESDKELSALGLKLILYSPQSPPKFSELNVCLPNHLKVISIPEYEDQKEKFEIAGDGHLDPEGAKFVAHWLSQKLGSTK